MPAMSQDEKEAFLADLHVGVLAINDGANGPLTAPIWYDYQPGGSLWFITGRNSRKGKRLEVGSRVSLVAQTEDAPYKYVSVEGPVTAIDAHDNEILGMAIRYLGEEQGKAYAAASPDSSADAGSGSIVVKVTPERWLTVDYSKG
ncbi:MAG: pyridoxamine 5'-phosphate oxidase family protein [Gammaproteobacteria bacterium]|nr:pyridoxamine 5'-phosphate oxidase family protein [Gammaproteobacteria bacterium]